MADTNTPGVAYTSTIKAITQGKDWEGGNKVIRTEYRVELANGQVPVFNIAASKDNKNREFPFKTGDVLAYTLTEKEIGNKIRQYGKVDMGKTIELHNKDAAPSEQKIVPLSQQQSIALSVALKLAKETFDSDLWQSYNKLKAKGKDAEETKAKTEEAIKIAKNQALNEIGQLTIVYYNTLTTKPQNK